MSGCGPADSEAAAEIDPTRFVDRHGQDFAVATGIHPPKCLPLPCDCADPALHYKARRAVSTRLHFEAFRVQAATESFGNRQPTLVIQKLPQTVRLPECRQRHPQAK